MEVKEVDFAKLNEAVGKFGSLQNANAQLEKEKLALEEKNTQLKQENKKLAVTSSELNGQIDNMKAKITSYQSQLQSLSNQIKVHSRQYELFCGFMAMIAESPSVTDSIKILIETFQKLIDSGWYLSKSAGDMRSLFVRTVMGDYLKCYRCDSCGARFIVNKEPHYKFFGNKYYCPACQYGLGVKEDESFLKAMVSEEQLQDIKHVDEIVKENETLKPLKAFLDITCQICGHPITEWTEDNVKAAVDGFGWAHNKCWNTDLGKLRLFLILQKQLQNKK